ncbi:MAG: porin family protein [Alphaproteobacteria bacterium]|nr:porin family protein [Alphaproteobacteria bacterium]
MPKQLLLPLFVVAAFAATDSVAQPNWGHAPAGQWMPMPVQQQVPATVQRQVQPQPQQWQMPAPQQQQAPAQRQAFVAPAHHRWYVGGRFNQNFMFFTETADSGDGSERWEGTHAALSQMGFDFFIGHKLNRNWRAEIELGQFMEMSDTMVGETGASTIRMSASYASFNITLNSEEKRWGWVYAGVGFGVAMPEVRSNVLINEISNSQISFMPSLMAGFRTRIAERWFADVGYRFSMIDYGTINATWGRCDGPSVGGVCVDPNDIVPTRFTNDFGWVMNHSVRLGLAYEF